MAYDPLRRVTVLFGGWNSSTTFADTWEWNGTAWTQRSATGPIAARYFAGCWWDAARSRVAIYGGTNSSSVIFSDTWEWDGTSWTQRTLSNPPLRAPYSVAYDLGRQRMVFFGGYNQGGTAATWELGTSWVQATPSIPPPPTSAPRRPTIPARALW